MQRRIVWQNVQDQPHIIAAYLDLRFRTYLRTVLCPYLQYDDFWWRYEWQARGSGHIHALFWVLSAPPLDQSTDASRSVFAEYWGKRITAWNPDPLRLSDDRNLASLLHIDVTNTSDQFAAFLNRLQMHTQCRRTYCLRKGKGSTVESCRFYFPRPLFTDPVVTKDINKKSWLFSLAYNQENLNQAIPINVFSWIANTDS